MPRFMDAFCVSIYRLLASYMPKKIMPSNTIKANNMYSATRRDLDLLIPNYGHLERSMPTDEPVSQGSDHDRTKDGSRVVHVVSCDWQNLRERHPKYHEDQIA